MDSKIISVRVDKKLREQMRMLEHINWSVIIRRALQQKIEELQKGKMFDKEKAKRALKEIDRIRESKIFDGGESGAEIIRKWRDKRRF